MPNSYSRRKRSNNSTFAPLSKPPLAPAPQVEGRLVTPGGVGQRSPAHGGHHSIAKPGSQARAPAVQARSTLYTRDEAKIMHASSTDAASTCQRPSHANSRKVRQANFRDIKSMRTSGGSLPPLHKSVGSQLERRFRGCRSSRDLRSHETGF